MSDYQNIILEEKGALCILTLNKPESRNPLTEETKSEIISALDYVEKTQGIGALIITGRGDAFCAGGDIKKIGQELAPDEIRDVMLKSQQLLKKLLGIEKPVIAAVNGDAFGMGFNLALAADFIIAGNSIDPDQPDGPVIVGSGETVEFRAGNIIKLAINKIVAIFILLLLKNNEIFLHTIILSKNRPNK